MSSILKVDTIQNTGGTTGLTVDSGGRVLNPNAVGWFVYKGSTQTASSSAEIVTWTGVTFNQGNGFQTSGANANKFVAPVHGLYTCHATLISTNDDEQHDISLRDSAGTSLVAVRNARSHTSNSHESYNIAWTGVMDANDTLHLAIDTSGRKLYGDTSYRWTTWGGHLIG